MGTHIEKCIEKYCVCFVSTNKTELNQPCEDTKEIALTIEQNNQFQHDFFIEMNEALFSGEYLEDNYTKKIEEFENVIINEDNKFSSAIRCCLQAYKDFIFHIETNNPYYGKDLFAYFKTQSDSYIIDRNYSFFNQWIQISIYTAFLDHTIINTKDYKSHLLILISEIEELKKGLADDASLKDIYEKLKHKVSFLLYKIKIYNENESSYYSVDNKIKNIYDDDSYKKIIQFTNIYNKIYVERDEIDIAKEYLNKFRLGEYSSAGFVILAIYYRRISKKGDTERVDNLLKQFQEFNSNLNVTSKFDVYAIQSISAFIYDCRFSSILEQQDLSIHTLEIEINKINQRQHETGCYNYHPYEKALNFLSEYLNHRAETNELITTESLNLFDEIYNKYKLTYKHCIGHHSYPFQLLVKDCITDEEIFIVSSFSKPTFPNKLKDQESEYRDQKQYFQIRARLLAKEKQIIELGEEVKSFRQKTIEYLGIFITITTFLFGGIQLFIKESVNTLATTINIVSIGIVLAIFMAMLYIVIHCKKNKIVIIAGYIVLCVALLAYLNKLSLNSSDYYIQVRTNNNTEDVKVVPEEDNIVE